ncbi:GDP-mannose 4,6-dehydratase [Haliea atlantica]
MSNFIMQALRNEPATPFGDGRQTRSFCYVGDLIEGIVRLMNSVDQVAGPMNLGNHNELTMIEVAKAIHSLIGSRSESIYLPLPADDPRQRQPDITMAKETLEWEPRITMEEGLKKTIAYFDELLKG